MIYLHAETSISVLAALVGGTEMTALNLQSGPVRASGSVRKGSRRQVSAVLRHSVSAMSDSDSSTTGAGPEMIKHSARGVSRASEHHGVLVSANGICCFGLFLIPLTLTNFVCIHGKSGKRELRLASMRGGLLHAAPESEAQTSHLPLFETNHDGSSY